MNYRFSKNLASLIMIWTMRLMPDDRITWADAMAAEFEAIKTENEKTNFALGCFKTALLELLRTRKALNLIGRAGLAAGLAMMCLVGSLVALNAQNGPFQITVLSLSLAYGLAAILASYSMKMLQIYAFMGLALSYSALSGAYLGFTPETGLPANLVMALSVEAAGLMVAILLASTFLVLLHSPERDLPTDG